jgi:two-component system chemotaxis sensor kinase CheA
MDDLLQEFIAETLESLDALTGVVVAWETDPSDRAHCDTLFRFFHTVKGSSGFLDLPRLERLSHAAEDVLDAIRSGRRAVDADTVSAVLGMMDHIAAITRGLGDGDPVREDRDQPLIDALVGAAAPEARSHEAQDVILVAAAEPDAEPDIEIEPAPRAAEPGDAAAPRRETAQRTIRLPVTLIEQLMNGVSDMVLARNELSRKLRERDVDPDLEGSFDRLSASVADMRDLISKTRMQRVDRLFAAVPRLVRDLCRDLGKQVDLVLDGGDVEMDREMIEMVIDPLTHIVRNALDHGIGTPAERRAVGKPPTGRLAIVARQSGNQIVIEISDDGKGIDGAAITAKAVASKIITEAAAAAMTDTEKLQLIFRAGLSTAKAVTSVSGRGVGMDVVRANVERIGGVVTLESTRGKGTVFRLRVPLTLTIIPGLILRCGSQMFAIPRGNVIEILHDNNPTMVIHRTAGGRIATIRNVRHALIELEDVLGIPMREKQGPRSVLVIRASTGTPYALGVEAVDNHEELVIRPASPLVMATGLYAGMTLPDSGRPMLLLDALGIAAAGGIADDVADEADGKAADGEGAGGETLTIEALHLVELTGESRLLPLGVVERVEDVEPQQVVQSAGQWFVRAQDGLRPVLCRTPEKLAEPGEFVTCLRLNDGDDIAYYPVGAVLDIVNAPPVPDQPLDGPWVSGLHIIGDRQFEMLDSFALFAALRGERDRPRRDDDRRLRCLIADPDDIWMRTILAPLLVQAGHLVTIDARGEGCDVVLCGERPVDSPQGVPVVALRADPAPADDTDGTIYRYDRKAVLGALARLVEGRAAAVEGEAA